jgi:hypothetical protein
LLAEHPISATNAARRKVSAKKRVGPRRADLRRVATQA